MADTCTHLNTIRKVTPSAKGCEECLKKGDTWFHLRLCRTCGHVGCCDSSKNKHATKHYHRSKHPIIEGYDPPEGWGWCYVDELLIDLGADVTPQLGPDPPLLLKENSWPSKSRKALMSSSMTAARPLARCARFMLMRS